MEDSFLRGEFVRVVADKAAQTTCPKALTSACRYATPHPTGVGRAQVDFNFGFGQLLKLEEVRFANWVTGPDGFFFVRTLLLPFLSHLLLRALPYVLLQQYGVSSTEHTQNIW